MDQKGMETREERMDTRDDHHGKRYEERIKILKKFLDLTILHQIFLACCVIAVSLDPLFFYVPVINNQKKCLEMDETLKKTVLAFRSLMDLTYIFHIAFQISFGYSAYTSESGGFSPRSDSCIDWIMGMIQRINWWIIIIDILCVLPIPQVVMFVYFSKLKGSESLNRRKFLNFIFISQFVPRIIRIYHSCTELAKNLSPRRISAASWVKGLFNFLLYVIASHFFGAFWYLLSVQRESACWQHACNGNSLCHHSNFFCKRRSDVVNDPIVDYLKLSCSLASPSPFDFGMFSQALKSGIVYSIDFPRKFFYCFSWGLRNLSSFGSNLETSTYFWESLFSAAITVIGLLLFIYLIGNLQTYLQFSAQDSEKRRRKMEKKEGAMEKWITDNEIPKEMGKELRDFVRQKMDEKDDVNVTNLVNCLPNQSKKRIKQHMCLPFLKKVAQLTGMSLKSIDKIVTDHLKPVVFRPDEIIFTEKEPLFRMLFITQGSARVLLAGAPPEKLERGAFYGEDLLLWAVPARPSEPPSSQAPPSEAPSSQAPASQVPSSHAHSSEAPLSQAPSSAAPSSQAPSSQGHSSEAPLLEAPSSQAPASQAPSSQAPASAEAPSSEAPSSQAPASQAPLSQADPSKFPSSPKTVKANTIVEAFALEHDAMKKIASALQTHHRDTKKTAEYLRILRF